MPDLLVPVKVSVLPERVVGIRWILVLSVMFHTSVAEVAFVSVNSIGTSILLFADVRNVIWLPTIASWQVVVSSI